MPNVERLRRYPPSGAARAGTARSSVARSGAGSHTTAAAQRRRLRADRARQLADLLRRQVLAGAYPDGVLPLEPTLGREYDATRNTVRQALDLLRAEGLVARVPGLGTVVVGEKYPHGLDRLQGLAETLHEHGQVSNEVRTAGPVIAPACVAERLGEPDGAEVLYVERLRWLGGLPLSLDLTYLPMDIGIELLGADLENTDIFRLIEELTGQPLGTAEITLEAVTADAHSATVLQAPRGAAVLMLERLTRLSDGRPIDLEFVRFRGDRITMSGLLHRSPPRTRSLSLPHALPNEGARHGAGAAAG